MNAAITPQDVACFRDLVEQQLGLRVDGSGLGILGELLRHRVAAHGRGTRAYLERLAARDFAPLELQRLAAEVTIGETYFFRNRDHFRVLIEIALPERLADPLQVRPLRILSAGCASGDEPYSIAIAIREATPLAAASVAIRAFDVNPAMLEKAGRGRYSSWSLREVGESQRQQWFRPDGDGFAVDPAIRRAVVFDERNLACDDAEFWLASRFDIVFCRNVLMYFSREQARAALARITRALAPGGYLFLGHAETLRGLSDDYQLCHSGDAFYYRRLDGPMWERRERRERREPGVAPIEGRATPSTVRSTIPQVNAWVDNIRQASERIRDLVGQPQPAPAVALPAAQNGPDLAPAIEYLRRERFGDVLDHLNALSAVQAADPGAMLLKAVSQVHRGELVAAEATCVELLEREQFDAGAHYVIALCREGINDAGGALEHARVAAYLDPGFAMPRLHLGLLARRQGDRAAARRELAQALPLLEQEDASRLLLFGGGFERQALVELCRAEFIACDP
jgi:chemotaxis protein methyltransferase CheR